MAKSGNKSVKKGAIVMGPSAWRYDSVEKLIDLLAQKGVCEFELKEKWGDLKISFVGSKSGQTVLAPAVTTFTANQAVSSAPSAPRAEVASSNTKKVTSPFVGTFYRSPSPTSEPYVKEGQKIKKGDVLCIVEAMKLMNEIESDLSGTVVSALIENGQPVEFGEPLFEIDTSGN